MNVAAILKHKGSAVTTSTPNAKLSEIIRILNKAGIGSVVILDEEEMVVGIISERDIIHALGKEGASALEQPVTAHMSTSVFTCCGDDTLEKLMAEMTARRHRHLPVVQDGRLLGLVSIGDVVKQRIAETEMEASAMRDYIATG